VTAIAVRGLHCRRGTTDVLRGIDLDVARGEVVAVLGASGSGKTTLLRACNYLTPFSAGEVRVADARLVPGMSERRDGACCRRCAAASAWCSRASRCSRT
jgi:ABC-type transporter Mla maintaining outer membrane lipid asymmetry ATPase subunit MlaF